MTVDRLPPVMKNSLEVLGLNQRLREKSTALDWSNVRYVDPAALSTLLADLDLHVDADVLGMETVPQGLLQRVQAVLRTQTANGTVDTAEGTISGPLATSTAASAGSGDSIDVASSGHLPHADQPIPESDGTPTSILRTPSAQEIRDELEQAVLRDLLGPAGGPHEEIAEDSVRERYLVGMLAPRGQIVSREQDDELATAGPGTPEEGQPDPDTVQGQSMSPFSMGLTFSVADDAAALKVTCRWGSYQRIASETLTNEKTGAPKMVWRRTPVEGIAPSLSLTEGDLEEWAPNAEHPDVYVRGRIRRVQGNWIVTLFLVNNHAEPKQQPDRAWLFQPELIVESPDGQAIFQRRFSNTVGDGAMPPFTGDVGVKQEQDALAMTYRGHIEFAVGHGVATHVETAPGEPDRAMRVRTSVVPTYEVPQTTPPTGEDIPALADLVLDMKALADMDTADILTNLAALPDAYAEWIVRQKGRIDDPAEGLDEYRNAAQAAMAHCDRALERIREGIALLGRDKQAVDAFRFMNRAMWQQRIHTIYAEQRRRGGTSDMADIDVTKNHEWRPFQLAFILINLPGITDLHHDDRRPDAEATADLLWFPTGGGKTEAYLGLTAYTLGIRRLQGVVAGHDGGKGVAVLMRYTLRLLTLQQFQRASALICACETIRRQAMANGNSRWGDTPLRVGLWVGQRTTPNTTDQADEAIKLARGAAPKMSGAGGGGTPAQITNCPWCGTAIDAGKNIRVETMAGGRGRTLIYCGDTLGTCPFSERQAAGEGLPILVVDDEIYRLLPALLIATVDKFAQMPWKGATAMLFGRVSGYCTRHGFRSPDLEDSNSHPARNGLPKADTRPHLPLRPPDLVIQDELHLISGPLGTLVGLYETAVDDLASWEVDGRTVRPKVIASTATIRQARDQMHSLFMRRVAIFPPQALDAGDNFFAVQRPVSEVPGRRYMGICAPGRRLKAVLIRVYVAHLAAGQYLYEKYGAAVDPWMTLVGYFNSMRELGGMRRLIDDDVRSRLQRADGRGLARRNTPALEELTSRKGSQDIPVLLDRLERTFDPANATGKKKAGAAQGPMAPAPLDVLLATNMVSVGVDVKRLGLMVVSGQPKSTSEYIQATSRVGRTHPGLVCTVLNWARPRDLSHYERFEHFHATFYQHVEALSVTPFAARALDRGLAALLVSLIRLEGLDFNDNKGAQRVTREHPYVKAAVARIIARAVEIDKRKQESVTQELNALLDDWLKPVTGESAGRQLGYRAEKDGVTQALLSKPGLDPWGPFTVLNSLRDVEPTVGLVLDDGVLGTTPDWSLAPPIVGDDEADLDEETA